MGKLCAASVTRQSALTGHGGKGASGGQRTERLRVYTDLYIGNQSYSCLIEIKYVRSQNGG